MLSQLVHKYLMFPHYRSVVLTSPSRKEQRKVKEDPPAFLRSVQGVALLHQNCVEISVMRDEVGKVTKNLRVG